MRRPCVRVGLLFVPNIPYIKPYLTVPLQIELLERRGMQVEDRAQAAHALRRIGYYRLSGYWYPFRHRQSDVSQEPHAITEDRFRPGTRFEDVLAIYGFDRQLRLLFLDAIERVEVAFRVEVALLLGKYGSCAHRDVSNFRASFTETADITAPSKHAEWMEREEELLRRSSEEFAQHYRRKYEGLPPIWIAIELWDFGILTKLLHGLTDNHLDELTNRLRLPRRKILSSLCQSINFVRNVCAHHGRLWNRPLVQRPAKLKTGEIPLLDHLAEDAMAQQRVYAIAAYLRYLLMSINPETSWAKRLEDLFAGFPPIGGLSPAQSGFSRNWNRRDLWQS